MAKTSSAGVQEWVAGFDRHAAHLDSMALGDLQSACDLVRGKLDAIEARRLASEVGADGDDRRARKMAGASGRRSKRTARAAARRAAAVSKNKKLAEDLESGDLSSEQLDAIADASAGDESAATDQDFIDEIKKRNADQARKLAAKRKHQTRSTESEYDRQQRLRRASRWKDFETGLSMLQIGGDDATIDEVWTAILARQKELKRQDGGRDLPQSQHPRTFDQRLFDAAIELLLGGGSSSAGSNDGDASSGGSNTGGSNTGSPSIVISISAETGHAHVAGGGPVSDEYVRSILHRANLSVQITDHLTGVPLWFGRDRRRASDGQVLALIVRDHGCVLCGAHWMHCEAHHLMPWNAPGQGETNIDEMALLCVSCHHRVHDDRLTLIKVDGVWKTRPALAHEIAPLGSRKGKGKRTARDRSGDHRSGNRRTASDFGPGQPRRAGGRQQIARSGKAAAGAGTAGVAGASGKPGAGGRAGVGGHGPSGDAPVRRPRSNTSRAASGDPDGADGPTSLF